ncbi:MAG TPA: DUF3667 domain-containing protein [Longimicrobium sp.]|nr:DUF3667 domain-containing protein [Longimicrobium sp.]
MSDLSLPLPSSAAAEAASASAPATVAPTFCISCGEAGARRYCPSCGQKVREGRFTMRRMVVDSMGAVLDLDRGLLFTVVQLSRRPGEAIREYVSGRTVRYTGPVKYFLLMATLTTILYLNTGLTDAMAAGWTGDLKSTGDPALSFSQARVVEFLGKWMNLIMAAGLPFSSVATWLFFRRAGYNLAEHLVFNTFLYAHVCLLFVALAIPAFAGVGMTAIMGAYTVASLAYAAWAGVGFFGGSPVRTALRATIANVVGYVAYIAFIFVCALVAGIAYVLSRAAG